MRTRTATLRAAAAGVVSAALGAAAFVVASPAGAADRLARTSHSYQTIHVTQADSGKQYQVHVGDHVVVRLTGPSIYTWTEPRSSRTGVLRRTKGTTGAVATGTFVATATGRAQVSATDDPPCFILCMPPVQFFSIEVRVRS
jgi:hypothetical protein